jgi:AcrR family transcriptional regulator
VSAARSGGASTGEARDLRQEILEAATGLFIQQGYRGLSMRQIAETLGVTKAALYYHFMDKEELFLAVLSAYLEKLEATLDKIQAEPVSNRERISRLVEHILAQPGEQHAIIRLASHEIRHVSAAQRQVFNQVYHEKFIDKIQAMLQAGMDQGEFRDELQHLDAQTATWALLGLVYPYLDSTRAREAGLPDEVIRQILGIYFEGIATRIDQN